MLKYIFLYIKIYIFTFKHNKASSKFYLLIPTCHGNSLHQVSIPPTILSPPSSVVLMKLFFRVLYGLVPHVQADSMIGGG